MDWLEQVLRLGVLLGVALLVWQVLLVAAVVWSGLHPPRLTAGVALGRGLPTEPADTGLAGRAEWFELPEQRVGGRRFAGGRTPGFVLRGERAGGPVVLLVSGHGGGRFGGLDRARQFAPHVSWLASYDQRGRGDSELPRCTMGVAEPADAVAVLEQVREAIAERSGDRAEAGRPVVLWGGSMGSATALDAARRLEQDGQEVAGVLLEGGYGRWHEAVGGRMRRAGLPPQPTTWLTGLVLRVVLGRGLHGRDGASDAGWLAQRGVRVGLLHAVGDVVAPLGAARRIAQAAGAELRVLNGPGHTRLAQQDPGWHAEQLAGFFEELAQREPRRQTG